MTLALWQKHKAEDIYENKCVEGHTKLLDFSEQIIREEFLDSYVLQVNQENLHKRLKMGFFILKENSPKEATEQTEEDLNCTMVKSLDPHKECNQMHTIFMLNEVELKDSVDSRLKLLFTQMN